MANYCEPQNSASCGCAQNASDAVVGLRVERLLPLPRVVCAKAVRVLRVQEGESVRGRSYISSGMYL